MNTRCRYAVEKYKTSAPCFRVLRRVGSLEEGVGGHEEHADVAGHLLVRVSLDECCQLLTERAQHGRHVFLGQRVGHVEIHHGLLQVPEHENQTQKLPVL